jgi:hypothetical protein
VHDVSDRQEYMKEYLREYRKTHTARPFTSEQKIRYNAARKARYAADPEPAKARAREWRSANPEKSKARVAEWLSANPDRASAIGHASRVGRRGRLAGAIVERFSSAEIFNRDGWACGICGRPIGRHWRHPDPLSASLDHVIPLIRGGMHSRANSQAAHLVCNIRKASKVAA